MRQAATTRLGVRWGWVVTSWALLGAAGAGAGEVHYSIGAARVDVTPEQPIRWHEP